MAPPSFNGDVSGWNVSAATDMTDMFVYADAFDQNLGNWYIVLDDTTINYDDAPGIVGSISARNLFLDGQNPAYGIGAGGDSDSFAMDGSNLVLKVTPTKRTYTVTVTSTGDFGTDNSRTIDIEISGFSNAPPAVDAGADQTIPEGGTVTLNGTATDADGDALTHSWSHNNPALSITLANATSPSTTFTAPQVDSDTTVAFTLAASDGIANATDRIDITITNDEPPATAFVTTWQTTGANERITIPVGGATGTYTVYWGDGSKSAGVAGDQTHAYAEPGNYAVSITGNFTQIQLHKNGSNAEKLVSIDRWGDIRWESMDRAFKGASNMVYRATDAPNLSGVTSMQRMFTDTPSFDGDLSGWDVSSVTDMSRTFRASSFNGDVSSWNVSGVTDMASMFAHTTAFDGDLSGWDVSGVTDMAHMFYEASSFDGDISSWNVSGVTDMGNMFRNATAFGGDLSGWDVSSATDLSRVFMGASSFDGDISSWNVSGATTMYRMFDGASSFDSDISGWDVSGVTDMSGMFYNAHSFEQNLGNWYVVLGDASIGYGDATRQVTTISPQNAWLLDNQSVTYSVDGNAGDGDQFEIDGNALKLRSVPDGTQSSYDLTILSSGGYGASNSKTVTVTVIGIPANTSPPSVDARIDQATVPEGGTATLTGTASDPDGDALTYSWSHDSSLSISFANATSPSTTFTAPQVDSDTTVTFTLAASDGTHTATGTVQVTINDNAAPSVDAGADQSVTEGDAVTLDGTATDADGDPLTYSWSHDSAMSISFVNATSSSTTFTAPQVDSDATITFTLAASDGTHEVTDTVDVTVQDVPDDSDFVTTWKTVAPGESVTIPASGTYTIDWGDGTVEEEVSGSRTHAYDAAGNHTVRISDEITRIYMYKHQDAPKLASIDQWGDARWTSMGSAFRDASNMEYNAADVPDLSRVRDMGSMFRGASSLDGDLSSWDTSGVRDMSYLFMDATSFDSDLSSWNVSRVTDMAGMFWKARSFDSDLSNWDVSSVTDMYGMFNKASSFDSDLSSWNVSSVTNMALMFSRTHSFDSDLSNWDVSHVIKMYSMFINTRSFNGDVANWDVSSVNNMGDMFRSTHSFNSDISGWDISGVDSIGTMLYRANAFDQNLGKWYIVLDDHSIRGGDVPGIVGMISAQHPYLDAQNPVYGIGSGGDSAHFEVAGSALRMVSVPDGHEGPYTVSVTSTGSYGTDNSRMLEITVADSADPAPAGPREVSGVTVTSTAPGSVQVSWDSPSEAPTDYRVAWAKVGDRYVTYTNTSGNAFPTGTVQSITGLDEGEEYKVKVRARYDSGGPGAWSNEFTILVASTQ